jgi:hydrophobe/amphiphile efflux-1 (HAE1) family protein
MRVSDVSIRNPVFAWMLMAGLIVFGYVGWSRMGVSQLPDVDFPVVTVTISLQGAAPEVMETTVADPLEDQLTSLEGLRTLTTVSTVGQVQATLEFELNRNVDAAVQDVTSKVSAAQKLLPKNVDPATITKTNPDDQPIIWLAMTSKTASLRDMMVTARNMVKDRFTSISGVGNVVLGGYVEPAMRVWLKPGEMRKRSIAVTDVVTALNQENIEVPGGDFNSDSNNVSLRTLGEASSAEEFGRIAISKRSGMTNQEPGSLVHLRDIATVEPGLQPISRLSRFNGVQAVGIGIVKQKGTNAVEVARQVKKRVAELETQMPPGYEIHINFDTTRFIEDAVHELTQNLILSAILTALACWVFLGSLSATFNVILSIPTSIMGAFIVLYFMGFTLNTFTLLGLSLAIGIVVDDAIMVLENIFRHNEEGLGRMEAAIVGAREISFAAMAATIAIVAIFLPVAFMVGVIGKFFFQFGVTITVTVLLSLLEALTITPMRCSRFVTIHERTDFIGRNFERFMNGMRTQYTRALAICLEHPWKVVVIATVVMAASFTSLKFIGKEFSPPQDQSIFLVRVKARVDASIPYTDALMKRVETYMNTVPEIKQTYVAVGGFGGTSYNIAMVFVTLKQPGDRPVDAKAGHRLSQQEVMAKMRPHIQELDKGLTVAMQDLSMRGFTASRGFPIEFTIRGENWEKLWDITQDLMKGLKEKNLATDVDTDYLLGKPQLEITPDRDLAALHGVSVSDIGTTIGSMIGGVRENQYTEGGHRYYVMLQVQPQDQSLETLRDLAVANTANQLTPMKATVTETMRPARQSVTRIDRQRAISVFGNAAPGHTTQDALDYIASREKDLPPGYRIVLSGSSQTFKESFQSLIVAFILGLFVAYMVLASQFNSFIDPVTVLVALPFSLSGAFLSLLITGQSLNIYSMIGLILLMGIVKKNSILLVDFTNVVRDRGEKNVKKALLEACPIRLRPIVMTSFACVTAAIPEALPFGTGSETTIPMAVSIIGGVIVSTMLTLFVVPCVYELFSRISYRAENKEEIKRAFIKVGDEGLEA